ncbi:S-adenosyl-L-methionine-dependent methyltransferase [Fennellomyces sp. T-0311]|nr:S-adenosyl-L-methionine-dependent methyltransferase [Fennellomyces sp. T-0311]
MPSVHPTASNGFSQADAYAQLRPTYPKEAISWIQLLVPSDNKTTCVLDLAAGTGIMTKLLAENYDNVTAVEPVDAMREKLLSVAPKVTVLKGTSWDIPVASQSQEAIVVAQAFHWFADLNGLREIHRVLKPGGYLILIWNLESKERSAWVRKLRDLYEQYENEAPQYRTGLWKDIFENVEASELFDLPLQHKRLVNDMPCTKENVISRIMLTRSHIRVLPQEKQEWIRKEVELILDDQTNGFTLDSEGRAEYPHDTDIFWTQRIG